MLVFHRLNSNAFVYIITDMLFYKRQRENFYSVCIRHCMKWSETRFSCVGINDLPQDTSCYYYWVNNVYCKLILVQCDGDNSGQKKIVLIITFFFSNVMFYVVLCDINWLDSWTEEKMGGERKRTVSTMVSTEGTKKK